MNEIDRRRFVAATTVSIASLSLPSLALAAITIPVISGTMAESLRAMSDAMAALERTGRAQDAFWQSCEAAGLIERDAFWDWYQVRPVRVAYQQALERAWAAVEAAFMTMPETHEDEDGVMHALASYEQIAPSAFAMQSARDLFTPPRYQSYPHDAERAWLLTAPDEMFTKSPMPGFLRRMRDEHRRQSVV